MPCAWTPAGLPLPARAQPAHARRGRRRRLRARPADSAAVLIRSSSRALRCTVCRQCRRILRGRTRVGRARLLFSNAHGDCSNCHTDGIPDGLFDSGLLPQSVDVNTEAYLAGGVDIGFFFGLSGLFTRNLTPHSETGLEASESEFVQVMRFGSDLQRPGFSLRVQPHFPADFRMTLEDLQAVYAFLRQIPPVDNSIEISP